MRRLRELAEGVRELAIWAAGDPYGDTWGGSGLAALALWRWLQILDRAVPSEAAEVDRALAVATVFGGTRLYRGMVRVDPLQPGLPQLDEEVTKLSAHVAWKNDRKDAAMRWLLNYLTIASSPSLDDVDRQILDEILASGMATRARLDLFRSKRLLTLVTTSGEKDKAAAELERLWRDPSAPTDVRADAGYEFWRTTRGASPIGSRFSASSIPCSGWRAIPRSRRRPCSAELRCTTGKRTGATPGTAMWKRSATTCVSCCRSFLAVS